MVVVAVEALPVEVEAMEVAGCAGGSTKFLFVRGALGISYNSR